MLVSKGTIAVSSAVSGRSACNCPVSNPGSNQRPLSLHHVEFQPATLPPCATGFMAGGARPAVRPQTLKERMVRRDGGRVKIVAFHHTGWVEAWQNSRDYRRKNSGELRLPRLSPCASYKQPEAQDRIATDDLTEAHNALHLEIYACEIFGLVSKRS